MNSAHGFLRKERWSPYLVGAGIGVLAWITFGVMGKALGVSTTMVRWAGLLESLVAPDHVRSNAYFTKYIIDKPAIDWQMMLVVGMLIGAFLAAWLSKSYRGEGVPKLWQGRFGKRRSVRYASAFAGGAIMLFGARLAGGCTSGHGISGSLQFSVSSWLFFASFFGAGVVTAFALFGKEAEDHG